MTNKSTDMPSEVDPALKLKKAHTRGQSRNRDTWHGIPPCLGSRFDFALFLQ